MDQPTSTPAPATTARRPPRRDPIRGAEVARIRISSKVSVVLSLDRIVDRFTDGPVGITGLYVDVDSQDGRVVRRAITARARAFAQLASAVASAAEAAKRVDEGASLEDMVAQVRAQFPPPGPTEHPTEDEAPAPPPPPAPRLETSHARPRRHRDDEPLRKPGEPPASWSSQQGQGGSR